MTENPLVAGSTDSLAFPNFGDPRNIAEGSGPAGGVANTIFDAAEGNWGGAAVEFAGVGLDALGIAMNPLKGLSSAGIGWLIEHIGFLKEGLDLLAGDPGAVSASAQTWTNIADALRGSAAEFDSSRTQLGDSAGDALSSYNEVVDAFLGAVQTAATHADKASAAINSAGVIVAVTRSLVRDWIADWVFDRTIKWLAASALTPLTGGGTQALFISDSVVSGARLSGRISEELTTVASKMDEFATSAAKSGEAFSKASRSMDDMATGIAETASKAARQQDRLGALAAQRRAAGENVGRRGARGSGEARARAHRQAAKAERRAGRQLEETQEQLAHKVGQSTVDQHARAVAESSAAGVAKEVAVQASNQEERKDSAREEYWRMRGNLEQ
jgi:hypothetical protein